MKTATAPLMTPPSHQEIREELKFTRALLEQSRGDIRECYGALYAVHLMREGKHSLSDLFKMFSKNRDELEVKVERYQKQIKELTGES